MIGGGASMRVAPHHPLHVWVGVDMSGSAFWLARADADVAADGVPVWTVRVVEVSVDNDHVVGRLHTVERVTGNIHEAWTPLLRLGWSPVGVPYWSMRGFEQVVAPPPMDATPLSTDGVLFVRRASVRGVPSQVAVSAWLSGMRDWRALVHEFFIDQEIQQGPGRQEDRFVAWGRCNVRRRWEQERRFVSSGGKV